MVDRVRLMLRVLEKRELDARRELARTAREVATRRAKVASVEQWIDAVNATMKEAIEARYAGGPRTVAALIESDSHTKALSAGSSQLRQLRTTSQQAVDEAVPRQKLAAREWHRNEARLGHVQSVAQRARIRRAVKASDAEDEAHAERRVAAGKVP